MKDFFADCIGCDRCVKVCGFLEKYGNPKVIDASLRNSFTPEIPFSCSLCSACETICPVEIPIASYFLAQRRAAVAMGLAPLKTHRGLIFYERMVASSFLTADFLPHKVKRILFPGCAAIGKAPQTIKKLYASLCAASPEPLGMVLDCCLKISHDLGREEFFKEKFSQLKTRLEEAGVTEILTMCPSCTEIFRKYSDFIVTPVYNLLAEMSLFRNLPENVDYAVHDACVLRRDQKTQAAVRGILTKVGAAITPLALDGERTLCCGEGGAVGCVDKGLAEQSRKRRLAACDLPLAVYCYGCRDFLDPDTDSGVVHILELVFGTEGRYPGFMVWFNRWNMKRFCRKL